MSIASTCQWLSIACVFLTSVNTLEGQQHYCLPGKSSNYVPIWKYYGNVDPFSRPSLPTGYMGQANIQFQYQPTTLLLPHRQNNTGQLQVITNATTNDSKEPSSANTTLQAQQTQSVIDSIQPVKDFDSSLLDDQDSASDIAVVASDASRPSKDEYSELKQQLDERDQKIARLETEVSRLIQLNRNQPESERPAPDDSADDAASEQIEKLISSAVSQAKKEAAWEISKLRKEAKKAKNDLAIAMRKAKSDREMLLSKLAGTESPNRKDNDPEQTVQKMTLAKLANAKRKLRSAKEQSARKSTDSSKQPIDKMNQEIQQALAKIEKRFSAKIENARKQNESDKVIKKLQRTMAIQMEKIEARIRNRYR